MAWNEPGNNKDKDPWGNKPRGGNDQGPPDFDELMKKLGSRMGGVFGGGKGSGGFSWGAAVVVLILAAVVWGISGFYTIKNAEQGVVLHFGQYKETVSSGLHWKPTFIDKVYPVDTRTVRSIPASGYMLTKDENVVRVQIEVQYKVNDPKAYKFNVTDAVDSLSQAVDASLRYVVGHTTMDDILTTGREQVRRDTWDLINKTIAQYHLGIDIQDVNFLPARAPDAVKAAFDDAIAAKEDEQRYIREAEAYASEVEPIARGKATRILQEADAYKQQVVLKAQGEVARFNKLLPEYEASPKVTRTRLYLETIEQVYGNSSKVLVDGGSGNLMYLPLDKLMEKQQSSKANDNNSDELFQIQQRQGQASDSGLSSSDPRGVNRNAGRTGRD
ncbi:FtsH protease activity modulator HflK [Gallaecimonas pentaromativorans]|uniref:FtsH protease activity modulator HflK n=1 Tax=Gallaecimonas pentaromativorans TaxID=584787 RepID=UPI00067EEAAF|nr:FtsH protease activity modulator HflK [Gallaecimonas pentaromativorans]MED5523986.1 FtsH protease activity modulator HflK [Pseudomonadota bacterium]